MKKLILLSAIIIAFVSCKKDEIKPNPTTPPIDVEQPDPTLYCEVYNFSELQVQNNTYDDFYVYINDVYIGTSEYLGLYQYFSVPAGLTHKVQFISISDNSDYRETYLYFTKCATSKITLN